MSVMDERVVIFTISTLWPCLLTMLTVKVFDLVKPY